MIRFVRALIASPPAVSMQRVDVRGGRQRHKHRPVPAGLRRVAAKAGCSGERRARDKHHVSRALLLPRACRQEGGDGEGQSASGREERATELARCSRHAAQVPHGEAWLQQAAPGAGCRVVWVARHAGCVERDDCGGAARVRPFSHRRRDGACRPIVAWAVSHQRVVDAGDAVRGHAERDARANQLRGANAPLPVGVAGGEAQHVHGGAGAEEARDAGREKPGGGGEVKNTCKTS